MRQEHSESGGGNKMKLLSNDTGDQDATKQALGLPPGEAMRYRDLIVLSWFFFSEMHDLAVAFLLQ